MTLQGSSAVITGANKNLGRETAITFAKDGCDLILHYHSQSSKEASDDLAKELIDSYKIKAFTYQGDLSVESASIKLFDFAIEKLGKVDIAINNVGKVLRKPLAETSVEEYDEMFRINTKAAFLFLREAAKKVSVNGSVIMLTTSLLGAYTDGYSLYQGSKASVVSMCKALSKETDKKISFNCVSPGPMDTPFLYGQENEGRVEFFKSQANAGRLTEVHDIVPIIKFLAKDGHWMTGQNLFANNGFVAV
ncbi:hypothetical protein DAMA08_020470 [Martiniozyma asiatica (nom. inval.)]|nr:hypothetical protein DAMA08_020470 [Martiniozyma asiatica]